MPSVPVITELDGSCNRLESLFYEQRLSTKITDTLICIWMRFIQVSPFPSRSRFC